jgi:hypothetical protein
VQQGYGGRVPELVRGDVLAAAAPTAAAVSLWLRQLLRPELEARSFWRSAGHGVAQAVHGSEARILHWDVYPLD